VSIHIRQHFAIRGLTEEAFGVMEATRCWCCNRPIPPDTDHWIAFNCYMCRTCDVREQIRDLRIDREDFIFWPGEPSPMFS
jgi:hypothetical protein